MKIYDVKIIVQQWLTSELVKYHCITHSYLYSNLEDIFEANCAGVRCGITDLKTEFGVEYI